jgi:hypothetical protein
MPPKNTESKAPHFWAPGFSETMIKTKHPVNPGFPYKEQVLQKLSIDTFPSFKPKRNLNNFGVFNWLI